MPENGDSNNARRDTEAPDEDIRDAVYYPRGPRGERGNRESRDESEERPEESDSIVSLLIRKGIISPTKDDPGELDISTEFCSRLIDKFALFNETVIKWATNPARLARVLIYIVHLTVAEYFDFNENVGSLAAASVLVTGLITPDITIG